MLDELRDHISAYLAEHQVLVVSTNGATGAQAIPVRYWSCQERQTLGIECLVPRWADVAYELEANPEVLLTVHDESEPGLRWLQLRGKACPLAEPDWGQLLPGGPPAAQAAARYLAIRVLPERIDLVDERRGWGVRETLDFVAGSR
jgi:hypothetical protein